MRHFATETQSYEFLSRNEIRKFTFFKNPNSRKKSTSLKSGTQKIQSEKNSVFHKDIYMRINENPKGLYRKKEKSNLFE